MELCDGVVNQEQEVVGLEAGGLRGRGGAEGFGGGVKVLDQQSGC